MADVVKIYECCVLFRPDLEAEDIDAEIEELRGLIVDRGGEIDRVDRWNKRYLAYPIKKYIEGYYVIYRWFSTKEVLPDLEYKLRYSDKCLRHLVLDYTEKEQKKRKRTHAKAQIA